MGTSIDIIRDSGSKYGHSEDGAVRDRQNIQGPLWSNRGQQLAADRGTLMATRSRLMVRVTRMGSKRRDRFFARAR